MGNLNIQHDIIQKLFFMRTQSGVARLDYSQPEKDEMEIIRTYVPEPDRQKGVGSALADRAIVYARERDMEIIPSCPFVKDYMRSQSVQE